MPNDDEIRLTSGFTVEERKNFRVKLDKFASQAASDYSHPLEAVVQEIRYWQQSTSRGRTNPNEREKRASFSHWKQECMVCKERIESLTVATFHHMKRGVPGLHDPENMRPLHRDESKGCHEKLHGAPPGTLTAGSQRRRA
jgi:hypothetical protein